MFFIDFQLALKRSNTLELEDVQEDVSDDINMGKNKLFLWQPMQLPPKENEAIIKAFIDP